MILVADAGGIQSLYESCICLIQGIMLYQLQDADLIGLAAALCILFPCVSEELWVELGEAGLQEVFQECMNEAMDYCAQYVFDMAGDAEQKLMDAGMVFIDDVDLDAFKAYAADYYSKSPLSASWDMDMVNAIRALEY